MSRYDDIKELQMNAKREAAYENAELAHATMTMLISKGLDRSEAATITAGIMAGGL